MLEKTYATIDKTGWPEGPWKNEPDKKQWTDKATGLPCMLIRSGRSGHLCGYVGVHAGHPLFGLSESTTLALGAEDAESEGSNPLWDISVHGGVTFTDFCHPGGDEASQICHVVEPGEDDKAWWFGFDCAHSGDVSHFAPTFRRDGTQYDNSEIFGMGTYRTVMYVEKECKRLAKQLANIGGIKCSR